MGASVELGQGYPAITGIGGVLGDIPLPNMALVERFGLDTDDQQIRTRTGIERRYHASEGIVPSDLGTMAARDALQTAGIEPNEIGDIFVSTGTPDHVSPSTASIIHGKLELPGTAGALDVGAACSGALYAYELVSAKMMAFGGDPTLAVSSEMLSRGLNPQDRRTAVLFGDGAAAAVFQQHPDARRPIFAQLTHPDVDAINVRFGLARPSSLDPGDEGRFIAMNGPRVVEHAVRLMPAVAQMVAREAGIYDDAYGDHGRVIPGKIDLFVPHQANYALIEPLADYLGIPEEQRVRTVVTHGNTSSASIPLGLHDAYINGRLDPDRPSRVLMVSLGAGMVAKAALLDVHIGGVA